MNEHEPHLAGGEARPARGSGDPDWRRLEVALGRFGQIIADGIATAQSEQSEIDENTARCIAHALGRAYGRDSALAGFGRTGEGQYLTLRDEYLNLYNDEQADATTKELIDWYGTYLVDRENTGTGRRFMNEHLPPKLEQLLVCTSIGIGDDRFVVNIPASWDSGDVDRLIELLTELQLPQDPALQTFLALPDVSVGTENIMESFHETFVGTYPFVEDAVRELTELQGLEDDLRAITEARGLPEAAVSLDYAVIEEQAREAYDIVAKGWQVHVFNK